MESGGRGADEVGVIVGEEAVGGGGGGQSAVDEAGDLRGREVLVYPEEGAMRLPESSNSLCPCVSTCLNTTAKCVHASSGREGVSVTDSHCRFLDRQSTTSCLVVRKKSRTHRLSWSI